MIKPDIPEKSCRPNGEMVMELLHEGVQREMHIHKVLRNPVVIWRDGMIVEILPNEYASMFRRILTARDERRFKE